MANGGPFETATRAAIEELILAHAQGSKFGYVLSHDAFASLTSDLYDLLVTSRNLKTAGDRLIGNAASESARTKRQGAAAQSKKSLWESINRRNK